MFWMFFPKSSFDWMKEQTLPAALWRFLICFPKLWLKSQIRVKANLPEITCHYLFSTIQEKQLVLAHRYNKFEEITLIQTNKTDYSLFLHFIQIQQWHRIQGFPFLTYICLRCSTPKNDLSNSCSSIHADFIIKLLKRLLFLIFFGFSNVFFTNLIIRMV